MSRRDRIKKIAQRSFSIVIDQDGVLANFVEGVEKEFNVDLSDLNHWGMWSDIGEQLGEEVTAKKFWERIRENPRFWADLKPYPWARQLINTIDEWAKGDTAIITSPDTSVSCASQKVHWIYKHFPHYNRKYLIGARKELLADDTTILIDDSQKNCDKFREAGGSAIEFPQLWNSCDRKPDMDCIEYIEKEIEKIVEQWSLAVSN